MRKIDPEDFRRATRDTPREVNRRIILTLLRERGPTSRADLARAIDIPPSLVTSLVNELLEEDVVQVGPTTETRRGRRPTLLQLRSHDRLSIGVDVQASRTELQLSDFGGEALERSGFETPPDPEEFSRRLVDHIDGLLAKPHRRNQCEGVGIGIPGMVDSSAGRVLRAPTLGWRDLNLLGLLARRLEVPVHIERDAIACAMAELWLADATRDRGDFAYVIVAEGVGTGVIVNGQPVRGAHYTAGEFGHVQLEPAGPICSCGSRGCFESLSSDRATVIRYLQSSGADRDGASAVPESRLVVDDIVVAARSGDAAAREALVQTGTYLGAGLSVVARALDPDSIIVGGAVCRAWDLIGDAVVDAMAERALISAPPTRLVIDPDHEQTRLRGAAALVVAPAFAAPQVA